MSGARFTTGMGIAIGGLSGAIAALMSAPKPPAHEVAHPIVTPAAASLPSPSLAESPSPTQSPSFTEPTSVLAPPPSSSPIAAPAPSGAVAAPSSGAVAAPSSGAVAAPSSGAVPPSARGGGAVPGLELPTTLEGLFKAEMLCDQKKDVDECARAAEALEKGTAGPADAEQGKRFRRIALTHLVAQCEAGAPHPCFVLAAKYRAGTELPPSAVRAEALEQRGLSLCRNRTGPECPPGASADVP